MSAVVYSDFQNDLEQVTNWLVKEVGQDAVAQHWGDYRSTELARFRNGRISYRECPRCGFQNEEQAKDSCERRLFDVMFEPHEMAALNMQSTLTPEQSARCWPERVHIFDSSLPGWRAWEQRDFDTFRDWSSVSLSQRKVWISTAPPSQIGSRLPLPVWPEQFSEVGMGAGVQDGPVGAATGTLLPAKLRGWGRCGDWRGPPRRGKNGKEYFHGCPQVWAERGVLYSESREHILSPRFAMS
ncbi:MAG: hypothetical protein SGPRY_002908 [Prymnesium sp.]